MKLLDLTKGHIARRAISSTVVRTAGMGLAFGQSVLAARLLGAHGFGRAAIVVSAAQVLAMLASLGFGGLAVRELATMRAADDEGGISAYFRQATVWVGGAALLAAGLFLAIAPFMAHPVDFRLGALLVVPLAFIMLMRGLAQGMDRTSLSQIPGDVLRPTMLLGAGALSLALGLGWSSTVYLLILALTAFLVALILAGGLLRVWPGQRATNKTPPANLLRQSLPFLGLAMVAMMQSELNTLLLGWLAGPREAGLFQPVARLLAVLVLPAQAAVVGFMPRIAEFWQRGETERIRWVTHRYTISTSLLTAGVAMVLIAAGPWIMAALGPEFVVSARLLWILGIAQVFNAMCGPLGSLLAMIGRSKVALAGTSFGLLVNLGCGLWLIPSMGAAGAAIALAAGIVAWNTVLTLSAIRLVRIDPTILGALRGLAAERGHGHG